MKVTMTDIAARAGTTIGVVSVTLNGARSKTLRVSDQTRERVLKAAAELGYRRDPRAGALANGRNFVIGLMLPHVDSFATPDPFYSLVTAGVAATASRSSYNLMLYTAVAEEEGARAVEKIDRGIDGLILVLPPRESPLFGECRRLGIQTVAILQTPDQAPQSVNSDDQEGARLATQHLIDLGHRRIAHLYGHRAIHTSHLRHESYARTLAAAGIFPSSHWVAEGGFNRTQGREGTRELLKLPAEQRPTAIFAANDLSAHGAMDALAEAGLRVPDDVSVVGYDDTWYASMTTPPLTSVSMSVERIGREAAEILLAVIEGREIDPHPVLPVSLIVRRSSGPAPIGILQ